MVDLSGGEVVYCLHLMGFGEGFDGFEFDEKAIIDEDYNIGFKLANDPAFIEDVDWHFRLKRDFGGG